VYERSAVEALLERARRPALRGRGGGGGAQAAAAAAASAEPHIRCPVAGATHVLKLSDLRSVRREVKRAAVARAAGGGGGGGGSGCGRGGGGGIDLDLA
jgi:hypothetical protein